MVIKNKLMCVFLKKKRDNDQEMKIRYSVASIKEGKTFS